MKPPSSRNSQPSGGNEPGTKVTIKSPVVIRDIRGTDTERWGFRAENTCTGDLGGGGDSDEGEH